MSAEVVLSAVTSLEATVLNSSAVRVTWQHGNASLPIVAYSIHFYQTQPLHKEVQHVVTSNIVTLNNLRPNTEYAIYVTAYAYQGTSAPSERVMVRTSPQPQGIACDIATLTQSLCLWVTQFFWLLVCIVDVVSCAKFYYWLRGIDFVGSLILITSVGMRRLR